MPMLADILPIKTALAGLTIGTPLHHRALTVVPLMGSGASDPGWLTLDQATDTTEITEVSEGGSVPQLFVRNAADAPLLLLDSEELVGAKQNRVLNTTVLVAAHSKVEIPVSCVEQGRWRYQGRRFSFGDSTLYASARRAKAGKVSESLRRGRGHQADQQEVWDLVANKAAEFQVDSPTGAMHDVYAHYRDDLSQTRTALASQPEQIGALVYVEGVWVGLELLPSPELFARAWPRLLTGYAADAIGRKNATGVSPEPSQVLELLSTVPARSAPAVGLGQEYRIEGKVVGGILVAEDRVAHLAGFPA